MLDRAEQTDLETWALPDDYREEWAARAAAGRPLPKLGTGSRGPATIMTSVLRPETVFYWVMDHPALLERFRDILAEKMVAFNQILRAFSGSCKRCRSVVATTEACHRFTAERTEEHGEQRR